MNALVKTLSVALSLALFGIAQGKAESFEHVDALAREVRDRANDICWEMYGNCRHQPDYRQTYRNAKEMWSIAGHIHDLVHNSASRNRIQRNATDIAELLTEIQSQVEAWGGMGLHGHEQSCSYRLKRKMVGLEEAVDHLLNDVGIKRRSVQASPAAVQPAPEESAPSASGEDEPISTERPSPTGVPLSLDGFQRFDPSIFANVRPLAPGKALAAAR